MIIRISGRFLILLSYRELLRKLLLSNLLVTLKIMTCVKFSSLRIERIIVLTRPSLEYTEILLLLLTSEDQFFWCS